MTTWNRLELSRPCLERLLETRAPWWRLTVVDNGSTDGTADWLRLLKAHGALDQLFVLARNMGVAAAQNLGWAASVDAAYYVKLDNDILVLRPDWLEKLISAANPLNHVAMAAYKLCPWHAPQLVSLADGQPFLEGESCGGGCVCISQAAHRELGFWNEDYSPYGYEDNEYGLRARLAGWRVGYVPYEGVTSLDPKGGEVAQALSSIAPAASPDSVPDAVASATLGMVAGAKPDAKPDADMAAGYARTKMRWVDTPRARQLWYINQFLFVSKLRPLRVERRSLPVWPETLATTQSTRPAPTQSTTAPTQAMQSALSPPDLTLFRPNPAYRAITAMHRAVAASPAFQAWFAAQ